MIVAAVFASTNKYILMREGESLEQKVTRQENSGNGASVVLVTTDIVLPKFTVLGHGTFYEESHHICQC